MKFIVISGADACGKDTQIERLEQFFSRQGQRTQVLSIYSSFIDFAPFANARTLNEMLNVFLLKFEPIARTLFLQSLIKNTLDKIDHSTQIVIFNGYWYKFAASEAAYGVPLTFWSHSAAQYFPKPDYSIHLDVPVEQCLERRDHWSPYEQGQARYWGAPTLNFQQFQSTIHQQFHTLFDSMGENIYQIDGNHNEDQVARNILSLFDESPMPKSTELFL